MPITPEDVTNAYRWLLGREPEERELALWLGIGSRDELRRLFVASSEFRGATPSVPPPALPNAQIGAPRLPSVNDVEWQADATADLRLSGYIQQTWNRIGKERPHWSVLSSDQFTPEHIDAHRSEFYQTGKSDVELIMNILQSNHIECDKLQSVVEYGCGVGRVTPHLAARFQRVTAIDISESHLDMAKQTCLGLSGLKFIVAGIPDFGMAEPFDLWFSYIVLQHNPPPIIALILARAFKMLAPGGVAIFQVTTWCDGYRFRIADYLSSRPVEPTIEVHCLPQRVIFDLAHRAGCVPMEVRKDAAMGPPSAWASHTFVFCKLGA